MENFAIAKHRDQLRYVHTRGGSWRPKVKKFMPGDYVYLQRKQADTLDVDSMRTILRVVQVGEHGVTELEGSDSCRWKEHVKQLAPCHLPNLDHQIRPTMWTPHADTPCQVCGHPNRAEVM